MTNLLLNTIFSLVAHLPLRSVHILGGLLGKLTFTLSPTYAQRMGDNLRQSQLANECFSHTLKQSIVEAGKASLELLWVWKRDTTSVCATVRRTEGWSDLQAAHARGKGVILLTPHLGCFDILPVYIGQHLPFTCLYRPPKQAGLDAIMRAGRERGLTKLAPADVSGVRTLYKALKRGEAILILPDQVPSSGEGEWLDFFGQPAYTMTLAARLASNSGAVVLTTYVERLPQGQGYALHIEPLPLDTTQPIPPQINLAMERIIARAPAQYLWSYNRYKTPKDAPPPP